MLLRDVIAAGGKEALKEHLDSRLLKPVLLENYVNVDDSLNKGLIVDVETTGLDPSDRVLELGFVLFQFSDDMQPRGILKTFSAFHDPGLPIPDKITELTGIRGEDVHGHDLIAHQQEILHVWGTADFVLAHNAAFDRNMLRNSFPWLRLEDREKDWFCSASDIDWKNHMKYGMGKLEYVLFKQGYYYSAHRAVDDCVATYAMLEHDPELFSQMLETGTSSVTLRAHGAPFDFKDTLKGRGYRWDSAGKVWYKVLSEEEAAQEVTWLEKTSPETRPGLVKTPLKDRFIR